MLENFVQSYVLVSLLSTYPVLYPYNFIVRIIGTLIGLPLTLRLFSHIFKNYLHKPIQRATSSFTNRLKNIKESVGWVSLLIALLTVVYTAAPYYADLESLEMMIRCEAKKEFKNDATYVYASVDCAVKNTGNITATIDSIEPTLYFSEKLTLREILVTAVTIDISQAILP